jgi:hypothetical protein
MMPGLARDLEELTAANLIVGWAENLGIVAAGVVSGVLMTLGGVAPVAIFSAALSGVALFLVFRLAEVRLGGAGPRANAFRQVRSGVTAVLHDRAAGILVTLLGVEFVVLGALDVLFVLLAIDVLHHGEDGRATSTPRTGQGASPLACWGRRSSAADSDRSWW